MNAWIASGAVAVALVAGFAGGRVSEPLQCQPARSDVAANYKAGHDFGYAMAAAADAERRAAQAPPPALLPAPPPVVSKEGETPEQAFKRVYPESY